MLPRKKRIPRKDFPGHKMQGLRVFSPFFTAVFYQTTKGAGKESRASVVVSKKTAKTAVARNTLRRRFYELLAPFFREVSTPTTVVMYPKIDAQKASFQVLKLEIEKAFKQTKLIK